MQPESRIDPSSEPTRDLTIYAANEPWPDDYALNRVVQDFNLAENYRSMNHDWRFRNADELYLAWMNQKFWEGTRIPRSSLGIYLIFEQVESLIPNIISSVFSNGPDFFEVDPMPTSTLDQARAVRDVMLYHLSSPGEKPAASVREVFRRVIKDACIYCNGVAEIGWLSKSVKRRKLFRQFIPKRAKLDLSAMLGAGGQVNVPTGEFTSKVREMEFTDILDRPFVRHVSIKDFYIDPNCPSSIVQEGEYCFVRKYMTLESLAELRGTYEFNIPSNEELRALTRTKPYAQADWTKSGTEMVRTGFWQPHDDYTSDPAGRRIEVLAYWRQNRLVWVANRKQVLLNIANPYGFIPFYSIPYCDVPDRFYGLSISDVNEGEQRLQQSIINGRLDELSIGIHTPMVKRRGVTIPAYQLRTRPGQIIEADNPKEDVIQLPPQNITQQAVFEVQASEQRAQKYTGVSDMLMGSAPSSGNSMLRTAAGVNRQSQATSGRVGYFVENFEDIFGEPLLRGLLDLEKRFLNPQVPIEILGQDGDKFIHDPLDVINADVKFSIRASAKMRSKQMLLQTFPMTIQTLLNPEFLSLLAQQQQMTVNVMELAVMYGDMTGYRPKQGLFMPMTPQMVDAMQQPPPDVKGKLQQQQLRSQTQLQVESMKQGHEKDMSENEDIRALAGQLFQSAPQLMAPQEEGNGNDQG